MKLQEQITNDLKEAMKTKDAVTLSVLRLLTSAIKNKQIATQKELSDDDLNQIIASQIKQRKDSIEQYQKGNREELAAKEQEEIKILKKYLPEQLDESKLKDLIGKAIKQTGAEGIKDMGKVMGVVMPKIKGKADGSLVSSLVKNVLNKSV